MKKCFLLASAALPLMSAAITPLWLRDAQISPDGTQIVFCYKGDLWKVPSAGGQAQRLTATTHYEQMPLWSPDGKNIAFASDRYGNNDIFLMSADGGAPVRLTYNSSNENPEAFSADGKYVLFSASIQDPVSSAMFPSSRLTELYQVPVKGGKMQQVLAVPAQSISHVPGTSQMLYQDDKGMENAWRKHHTSSIARDLWLYDSATGKHTKLTANHAGEDRNPVADGQGNFYFLSERNGGSMNVYKAPISDPDQAKAVTNYKTHPVRFLSRANNGTLCFTYDGEIYTMPASGKAAKVSIDLIDDGGDETVKMALSRPSEMAVSPDGKMIALGSRGEVFVTSADYKTTKQITNTPEAEKHVAWGDDSKSLYYVSERNGQFAIYKATMGRPEDPNLANATVIEEEPVFKADNHERTMPKISPDGKKMAFVLDRTKLAVRDMESGKVTQLTDGSTTTDCRGAINYAWSPDSKWIAAEVIDRKHDPYYDIAVINVADGSRTNITGTGYFDEQPHWVLDGNAIIYGSDRYGMRNHASWGSQQDVMIAFLNQKAYDDFMMTKEDAELAKDKKKEDKKKEDKKKEDSDSDKNSDKKSDTKDIEMDLARVQDRTVRLTPFSSDLKDAFITNDGETLFFITGGADDNLLWEMNLREGEIKGSKNINRGLNSFEASADGKTVFILGSQMQKFNPSNSKLTPVTYSATMKLDLEKEREYMYDNMVREEKARFYETSMHGVDWDSLSKHYRKFLPHINNNYDFAELNSELLGELNVSHTGSGYYPETSYTENTASLGLLYDLTYTGDGLLVAEVVHGGPFDNADSRVVPGVRVEKINGVEVLPDTDYTSLLTDIAGKKTLVSFRDPATGDLWDEVVKPITISKMNNLLYKRWVEARAADVDRWSNGRLGYVHIKSMGDPSFRDMYADVLGKYNDRDGIVIDIRYNGGGRLHEDIEVLFSGKKYLTQVVRGLEVCDMPSRRWNKPSIMVTAPACYSNAHGSPWVYQTMGLGKIVGMPVPGTMTSVNWVTMQDPSLYFGIPVVGYRTAEGYYLENHQLTPDVLVDNDPALVVNGEDTMLRTAVEELLKEIKN